MDRCKRIYSNYNACFNNVSSLCLSISCYMIFTTITRYLLPTYIFCYLDKLLKLLTSQMAFNFYIIVYIKPLMTHDIYFFKIKDNEIKIDINKKHSLF